MKNETRALVDKANAAPVELAFAISGELRYALLKPLEDEDRKALEEALARLDGKVRMAAPLGGVNPT